MKVEMKVDWDRLAKPKARRVKSAGPVLEPPRSRAERRLWYIAVGREIEAGVGSGRFASYADAARRCGVSRARVSQMIG